VEQLFRNPAGFEPNAQTIRNSINSLSDNDLINESIESLEERVSKDLSLPHGSIEDATPRVQRSDDAASAGHVVYEHELNGNSILFENRLSGMTFPMPRHSVRGSKLILRYDASQPIESIRQAHQRDLEAFRNNVVAANRYADAFNASLRRQVRTELNAAQVGAQQRKRLADSL